MKYKFINIKNFIIKKNKTLINFFSCREKKIFNNKNNTIVKNDKLII